MERGKSSATTCIKVSELTIPVSDELLVVLLCTKERDFNFYRIHSTEKHNRVC